LIVATLAVFQVYARRGKITINGVAKYVASKSGCGSSYALSYLYACTHLTN